MVHHVYRARIRVVQIVAMHIISHLVNRNVGNAQNGTVLDVQLVMLTFVQIVALVIMLFGNQLKTKDAYPVLIDMVRHACCVQM